jgi:hypothetical protein
VKAGYIPAVCLFGRVGVGVCGAVGERGALSSSHLCAACLDGLTSFNDLTLLGLIRLCRIGGSE